MSKWIFRFVLIGIVGWVASSFYVSYKKGHFNIPNMPQGSYWFSLESGMRGIVLDAQVSNPILSDQPKFLRRLILADPGRKYFGIAFEVAPWMLEAWSTCTGPTDEERTYFLENMPDDVKKQFVYARFDAVCIVDVDGTKVALGLLYSVPKL